jgi:hypothetical protein
MAVQGVSAFTAAQEQEIDRRVKDALEKRKEGSKPGWAKKAFTWALRNPSTVAKVGLGIIVANQLSEWGILSPLVNTATYTLSKSTLGYDIPLSPLSAFAIGSLAYGGYDAAKGAYSRLKKTCIENPVKAAGAAFALYETGIGSALIGATAAAATTPLALKVAAIGLAVDYAKSCYQEGTLVPQAVKDTAGPVIEAVKNPEDTLVNCLEAGIEAADRVIEKVTNAWDATKNAAQAIYDHSLGATVVGAAASVAALAFGFPAVAAGLAITTGAPAGLTLAKWRS